MGKIVFFDAGPIITLVMSRLSWILPELKRISGNTFYITPAVKYELIDRPLTIKRFQFEALQVLKLIHDGVIEIYDKVPKGKTEQLKKLANSSFKIKNKTIDILQAGEMESVTSALQVPNSIVVMDERTLRLLIENNKGMKSLLERRFRSSVTADSQKMNEFSKQLKSIKIIRSIELVSVAYSLGLLDNYVPKLRDGKRILINSILWATKYNGCAVNEHEIEEIKSVLLKNDIIRRN